MMRKLIPAAIVVIAIVAIAATVLAHGPRSLARRGQGYAVGTACPYAGLTRDQKFAAFDANHDRFLSRAEFHGPSGAFPRVDRNTDGLISRGEWMACPYVWTCCTWHHGGHAHSRAGARNGHCGCCR
jgi:hypothetical protein